MSFVLFGAVRLASDLFVMDQMLEHDPRRSGCRATIPCPDAVEKNQQVVGRMVHDHPGGPNHVHVPKTHSLPYQEWIEVERLQRFIWKIGQQARVLRPRSLKLVRSGLHPVMAKDGVGGANLSERATLASHGRKIAVDSTLGGDMPDASDDYYYVLGRMICRAAEAEVILESLADELLPERGGGWFSAANADAVAKAIRGSASRWPSQADEICRVVDVMRESAEVRNWLVHAWVLSPVEGDWVELQKPIKRSTTWGQRRIHLDEVDLLTGRFSWVVQAVTRIVNQHDWEIQGVVDRFGDGLPEPPPLPPFVERSDVHR
ncbi:hypothetical protein P0Y31_01955 [Knoellia sp. 3-2P3]|uniref:hypothetical protein n=1 Tax=unclassified Knoellia TaxID=2618719 RepID=UPI0023DAD9D9|nr:hypothetical protein [Knoellia sp. 3-2P3]MDF2091092.1 hypothetical protein [Knoellia sp. 3-2P3]